LSAFRNQGEILRIPLWDYVDIHPQKLILVKLLIGNVQSLWTSIADTMVEGPNLQYAVVTIVSGLRRTDIAGTVERSVRDQDLWLC
jgi:hypothetical protein